MTINAAKLGLAVHKCCHCGAVRPQNQMQAFCHHHMGPVCNPAVSQKCYVCQAQKSQSEALKQRAETKRHYDQFAAH